MKWVLIILAVIVGLIVLVTIIGLLIPRSHSASRSIRLRQSPETLWDAITNLQAMPEWRGNVVRVEPLGERDGKPAYREAWKNGGLSYVIETSDPPWKYVTRIIDESSFGGTWTYLLQADSEGTRLTITEDGEIYNPIFRVVARFLMGYHATIDSYLTALARKLGEPAQLEGVSG